MCKGRWGAVAGRFLQVGGWVASPRPCLVLFRFIEVGSMTGAIACVRLLPVDNWGGGGGGGDAKGGRAV